MNESINIRASEPTPAPPTTIETTAQVTVERGQSAEDTAPFLTRHLRNVISIVLLAITGYLALLGIKEAQIAVIQTFVALAAFIFGERTALKRPGQDN